MSDAELQGQRLVPIYTKLGQKIARIQTACERLEAYLTGKIDALPELEEKRLPFLGKGPTFSYNALYSAYNHA